VPEWPETAGNLIFQSFRNFFSMEAGNSCAVHRTALGETGVSGRRTEVSSLFKGPLFFLFGGPYFVTLAYGCKGNVKNQHKNAKSTVNKPLSGFLHLCDL